jgi:glucosyl-dolichyl phosphate glucuronosyltransferase
MGIAISVVICTYNRCERLATVLRSLENVETPPDLEWETLVVDNNSKDRTRAVVEGFIRTDRSRVRYLFEGRQGKSHALNSGIAAARGDIIAFTDDDVTVHPGWLREIRQLFASCDCLGMGGRIIPTYGTPLPPWLRLDTPVPFLNALVAFDFGNSACPLKAPPFGANMAFKRDAFARYGPFRTDLGPVAGNTMGKGEDSEFSSRLLAAGEPLMYASNAVVYHPVEPERMRRKYFEVWYFNHGIATTLRSFPSTAGASLCGIPRYLFRQFVTRLAGWLLALDGHRRFCAKLKLYEAAGELAGAWQCRDRQRGTGGVRPGAQPSDGNAR